MLRGISGFGNIPQSPPNRADWDNTDMLQIPMPRGNVGLNYASLQYRLNSGSASIPYLVIKLIPKWEIIVKKYSVPFNFTIKQFLLEYLVRKISSLSHLLES